MEVCGTENGVESSEPQFNTSKFPSQTRLHSSILSFLIQQNIHLQSKKKNTKPDFLVGAGKTCQILPNLELVLEKELPVTSDGLSKSD